MHLAWDGYVSMALVYFIVEVLCHKCILSNKVNFIKDQNVYIAIIKTN